MYNQVKFLSVSFNIIADFGCVGFLVRRLCTIQDKEIILGHIYQKIRYYLLHSTEIVTELEMYKNYYYIFVLTKTIIETNTAAFFKYYLTNSTLRYFLF